jgi:hypothetical protein
MNKRCRTVEIEADDESNLIEGPFLNYGNAVTFHAVREHAIEEARRRGLTFCVIKVETYDADDENDFLKTFSVAVEPMATVLNPRLDTDKVSAKEPRCLSNLWGLL